MPARFTSMSCILPRPLVPLHLHPANHQQVVAEAAEAAVAAVVEVVEVVTMAARVAKVPWR